MKQWHATRKWTCLDSIRLLWYKIMFRPKLAFNVLFRYSNTSILHNYIFNDEGREPRPSVKYRYITNCDFIQ